jgi:MSHA biogenesis protein MshQ
MVSSDLTDFPLLVDITDVSLPAKTQSGGQDIVFVDADNQKLDHQIESYGGSGHLVAWVRVPFLSSTVDTPITMYYGNSGCGDQQSVPDVWDVDYLMVQHLNQGSVVDSTANGNDGGVYGSVVAAQGKVGGAFDFSGGYVSLPRVCTSQTQFTFSAWIYPRSGARYFISQWNGDGAFLQVAGNAVIQLYVGGAYVQQRVSMNQWQFVVGSFDGSVARLYVNGGAPASSYVSGPTWPNQGMYVGDRYDYQREFLGLMDEVRVSGVARSGAWISTEYSNQNNPGAFYSVGTEETQ